MALSLFAYDSHDTVLLQNCWTLSRAHNPADDPAWKNIPARVPGCVHLDLLRADLIPDPFVGLNEKEVAWVADEDWCYTLAFTLKEDWSEGERTGRRQLVCETLDTFAELRLDGELLGETANAFFPHRFDLPESLPPGEHTLEILFRSPVRTIRELADQRGHAPAFDGGPRSWARKPQYSYGWDWGPVLPSSGLMRPIFLQRWYDGRVAWWRSHCEPGKGCRKVHVQATVQVEESGEYRLLGSLARNTRKFVDQTTFYAEPGENTVELVFTVSDPDLWQPAGQGEPHRYELALELIRNRRTVHEVREPLGVRNVEWVEEPDEWGRSFKIRVNGRDVFCKGANWVPGDSFTPRVTEEQVRRLFQMALDAGMNMLRIWGGGQYEPPWFYRLADEMGLMIWQDFPYACSLYPDDPEFLANAEQEAHAAVQQLARHPSIVIWCGNNEIQRDETVLAKEDSIKVMDRSFWDVVVRNALETNDPNAFYIQSSPTGGSFANDPREGDRHVWEVWNGWGDVKTYLDQEARFVSEFGFHGFPHPETLRDVVHPGRLSIQDEQVEGHNKQIDGPARHHRYQSATYPVTADYDRFLRQSQDLQGRALRPAIEHWRRRLPRTMGTLIWQLNDCWPVISWSLIDYRYRPKAAWYQVRRAFAPRTAFLTGKDTPELWAVNDTDKAWEAQFEVSAWTFSGARKHAKRFETTFKPHTANRIEDLLIENRLENAEADFLVADVSGHTGFDQRSVWLPKPFKHVKLEATKTSVEQTSHEGRLGFLVRTDKPSFGLWLGDPENPDVMLTDNAFDLLPGEERVVLALDCRTGEPTECNGLHAWTVNPAP